MNVRKMRKYIKQHSTTANKWFYIRHIFFIAKSAGKCAESNLTSEPFPPAHFTKGFATVDFAF